MAILVHVIFSTLKYGLIFKADMSVAKDQENTKVITELKHHDVCA